MKAFCSNCGSEVETKDPSHYGTEAFMCTKCGARGTVTKKTSNPSPAEPSKGAAPLLANISLNILDILKLNAGTQSRCPRCGNYTLTSKGTCSSCDQELS